MHILIVDERNEQAMTLADFLVRRNCRTEVCSQSRQALHSVEDRANRSCPYDAVILVCETPDPPLMRQFRRRDPDIRIVLCTPYSQVDPALAAQASQQGCHTILDVPIDLMALDRLVHELGQQPRSGPAQYSASPSGTRQAITTKAPPPQADDQTPFFGTARLSSPSTGSITRTETDRHQRPSSSWNHPDQPYTRQTSQYFDAAPTKGTQRFTTARHRRSVRGGRQEAPDTGQHVAPAPSDLKRVACAVCGKPFTVQRKDHPYTVACIHCGALNRIMPG